MRQEIEAIKVVRGVNEDWRSLFLGLEKSFNTKTVVHPDLDLLQLSWGGRPQKFSPTFRQGSREAIQENNIQASPYSKIFGFFNPELTFNIVLDGVRIPELIEGSVVVSAFNDKYYRVLLADTSGLTGFLQADRQLRMFAYYNHQERQITWYKDFEEQCHLGNITSLTAPRVAMITPVFTVTTPQGSFHADAEGFRDKTASQKNINQESNNVNSQTEFRTTYRGIEIVAGVNHSNEPVIGFPDTKTSKRDFLKIAGLQEITQNRTLRTLVAEGFSVTYDPSVEIFPSQDVLPLTTTRDKKKKRR